MQQEKRHIQQSYEHMPEWLYTTNSGCAFGTPALLYFAPRRALKQ